MKRILIHIFDIILFLCVLILILLWLSHVLLRKETLVRFGGFLDKPEQYDVLIVGDSHTVNAIYPMELWNSYGLTSYNLSSYGNTLPVTYWITKLALERTTPKVVVIGIKDLGFPEKLTASSGDLHTAFDCFPLSRTKIEAIWDLTDNPNASDDYGYRFQDLRAEYLFPLLKYHSRWPEITAGDFGSTDSLQKGGTMAVDLAVPNEYTITEDVGTEDSGFGYQYLRKTIELCQSKNIDVVLINPPYPATYESQVLDGVAYYIAQEYGIPCLDFVYMDSIVDYNIDMFDSFSHLNPSGARKVTDYLGKYLTDHYPLVNHKNDPVIAPEWEKEYAEYDQYKLSHIDLRQSNPDLLLMLLHDPGFSVILYIPEHSDIYHNDLRLRLIQNMARRHLFEEDEGMEWADALFPLEELTEACHSENSYLLVIDRNENRIFEQTGASFTPISSGFGSVTCDGKMLFVDNDPQLTLDNDASFYLLLYDELTRKIERKYSIQ